MNKFYKVLLLAALSYTALLGGTTGKIAGKVVDGKSGEPLPGVTIILVGTSFGASTDFEGNYFINNIQPGTYTLKASSIGFASITQTNVKVNIDLTTRIDLKLSEEVLEGKEVTIVAERPLVQKDLTAKTAIVEGDQIQALPVTEIGQVLALQAGFVAGSLRGGRSGEVAYWIDGVPVTDAFDGGQVVEVNKSLVQEMQLVSGAFNAEYGQAMSGIVNIATKEGGPKFTGGFGIYGGDYLTNATDLFPGLKFNPVHIRNIEGNLSGPVLGEALTFFANARYIYFDGWRKGFNRFNPSNIAYVDSANTFHLYRDQSGKGDSSVVSMNNSERYYGQGKLTWRISPLLKLTGNFIYDYNIAKAYDRIYFYDPNGIGNNYTTSQTFIFQLSHTLSSSTFYTLGGSYLDKNFKYYLYKNPYDTRYTHPRLLQTQDAYSFLSGGTDLNRFNRTTQTMLAKLDVSSQMNTTNLVKAGIEFRRHDLKYDNLTLQPINSQSDLNFATGSPFITTEILDVSSGSHDYYHHNPVELSGYIQDKMEFKEIIVNIGVRYDYFQPDGVVLVDPTDPSIYAPIKPENIFFDTNGNGQQDPGEPNKTVADRRAYWYKKATAKSKVSPRLGVSFPVTDRGVVHFSYGHFFQIPRFERLYENPDFKIGLGTGNQGVIGNADLEPEETISSELGVQMQLSDDISTDITAYVRDIRGLTGTQGDEIVVFGGASRYSKYTNSDFGFVKGIIITAEKRFSNSLNLKADYTFQIARGSASDPAEARNAVAGGAQPDVQVTPLGWDQRHTLNVSVAYTGPGWGVSSIGQYGSGTPYTPRKSKDVSSLLTNSQLKPEFFNVDVRAYYEFTAVASTRCVLFARIFNILDIRNQTNVYNDTGSADFTTDEAIALKSNPAQRINTVDQWFRNPTFYSEPRRIEFGINLEF
ncbi:MAG TPA: TonB-dependent receptor [Bacteroidota bacterium]|nr:TonB-dependent receptor [Bacteroidota bacterium]